MKTLPDNLLLAYKPFWIGRGGTIHPYLLPHIEWDIDSIVTSPCHYGHETPVGGCTCGILSFLSYKDLANIEEAHPFPALQTDEEVDNYLKNAPIPVIGIIQVLGEFTREENVLRSWGGFIWGFVRPQNQFVSRRSTHKMTMCFRDFMLLKWNSLLYRPVIYDNLKEAHAEVKETWRNYDI